MSENGNGPGKMPLTCAICGQVWSMTPNIPEIFNTLKSSGCVLSHEKVIRCPKPACSTPYLLTIQNVSLMLAAQPIDESVAAQIEGSNIVKPSLSLIG